MLADKVGAVMVIGGGVAGIQAAYDLAETGYHVYLVEEKTAIGGTMAQLDKTFPTDDCAMCIISPKLVEAGRHPNIDLITGAEVTGLDGEPGNFRVRLKRHARYVDPAKCTSCGDCVNVCPVEKINEFDGGLAMRHAIYKLYPQAAPAAYAVDKTGISPCRAACPAGVNAQGYIQLIAKGDFIAAWELVYRDIPFPAACGRVCVHPCQTACYRGQVDQPVNIMYLKRAAADAAYADPASLPLPRPAAPRGKRVAVVGAGPAGLAAASRLVTQGYGVTVFEALPAAGGMLRVGIPEYRLPKKWVDLEVGLLERLGVEIKLGHRLGRDMELIDLRRDYDAVFLAMGAHRGVSLGLPGEDLPQVMQGVDFLRRVAFEEDVPVGSRVAVIGGGNTAMDCARTAVRLGAAKVSIVYRRTEKEITALPEEMRDARAEGIEFVMLTSPVTFQAVDGKLVSLRCVKNRLGEPDAGGRRSPVPITGSEEDLPVDTVLIAVGQTPGPLPGAGLGQGRTVDADPLTLATAIPGVFAGGDVVTGPRTVVEAMAAGSRAAESIDRYLSGRDLAEGRTLAIDPGRITPPRPDLDRVTPDKATQPPAQKAEARRGNFVEVTGAYGIQEARREAKRCLSCSGCAECLACVRECRAEAIRHLDTDEEGELTVGAVVVSAGFEPFVPGNRQHYGWGQYPNVVTSLQFERLISASGPNQGHLVRPSDGTVPRRIAFIQCVGSRDVAEGGYCSAVCCAHAVKEAVVAVEHTPYPLESTIFYMDLRMHGKEWERYLERARDNYGIRLVRSRIYGVDQAGGGSLKIRYATEEGIKEETFDLVVLSVGLKPPRRLPELAGRLGVELNGFGFLAADPLDPVATSRPGVYGCGAVLGPVDIPGAVTGAQAAAGEADIALAQARGQSVRRRGHPPERAVAGEETRIGVFVCRCGVNIAGVVDVPAVREFAEKLPGVAYAGEFLFTCSQDAQSRIKELVDKHALNRVVVASCSPRTHEATFQETLREAGLNPYLFDMANIREQCSWVHMKNQTAATEKAKDLVATAVARSHLLQPLQPLASPVEQRALVVGGGVAGLNAALNIARAGFPVCLVEKESELGGVARRIGKTLGGLDVRRYLGNLVQEVEKNHPLITVLKEAEVQEVDGFVGSFVSRIVTASGAVEVVRHGVAVLAVGAAEYRPEEYLYGEDPAVMTGLELEEALTAGGGWLSGTNTVVFIQCVGSREGEQMFCSRVCCGETVKNVLRLKELDPDRNIYVLYRDIRTYGVNEEYYRRARAAGVVFIPYEPQDKPQVSRESQGLAVRVREPVLNITLTIETDLVVLAAGMRAPADSSSLARRFKVSRNQDDFFLEAHLKLRPVDFNNDGIFVCGTAHGPKYLDESIMQAKAAAARAVEVLVKDELAAGGVTSSIDPAVCSGCKVCLGLCAFGAISFDEEKGVAAINEFLCKGCGVCATACPTGACRISNFGDDVIIAEIEALCGRPAVGQ